MIRLKRVYEPAAPEDGQRYLVERLWPRGLKKEAAHLTGWLRELTPSPELHRWYGHDPAKWEEFKARYLRELQDPDKQALIRELGRQARRETVTLVFATRAWEISNAVVLKRLLEAAGKEPG